MLRLYRDSTHPLADASLKGFPREVIWIDLVSPTDDEKNLVEKRTGVKIPSVEALNEIESSSRLAVDRDIITLSTPVVAQGDGPDAFLSPVGFILTKRFIVSIRFAELVASSPSLTSFAGTNICAPARGCSLRSWRRSWTAVPTCWNGWARISTRSRAPYSEAT